MFQNDWQKYSFVSETNSFPSFLDIIQSHNRLSGNLKAFIRNNNKC